MSKLYGWGASVVIVGALFKIMHFPGAGIMLTVGLLIEAIIFFFSAFEPLHEELDWTLVYPELAGMTDPDELDNLKESSKHTGALERFDDLMGGLGGIDPAIIKSLNASFDKLNLTAAGMSDVTQATAVTTRYVQNVGAAADSVGTLSATFQHTAAGLQQSATAINNSSAAITAFSDSSKGYTNQLDGMNKNLTALNGVYESQLRSTNDQMQKSKALCENLDKMLNNMRGSVEESHRTHQEMSSLNSKYVQSVGAAAESVGNLSNMFQQTAQGLQQSASAINHSSAAITSIGDSSKGYASQLDGMNRNLAALNAVYELQLRSTSDQMQKSKAVYGDLEKMLSDIRMGMEETHRYRDEMANLNRSLASLNTIYGNMLSAMNVRS
jgi:gliding motility-associated protein GldL